MEIFRHALGADFAAMLPYSPMGSPLLRDASETLGALLGIAAFVAALWRYVIAPASRRVRYELRLRRAALRLVTEAFPRDSPSLLVRVRRLEEEVLRIEHDEARREEREREAP